MLGRQEFQELELDIVRILEFIDKNVFVFLLKLLQDRRPLSEKLNDQQNLVLEINFSFLLQQFLIAFVYPGDFQMLLGFLFFRFVRGFLDKLPGIFQVPIGFDVFLFQPLDGIQEFLDVFGWITEGTVIFQRELKEMLSEENGLFHIIQKLEIRRITQFNAVIPQNPLPE